MTVEPDTDLPATEHDPRCTTWTGGSETCRDADGHEPVRLSDSPTMRRALAETFAYPDDAA